MSYSVEFLEDFATFKKGDVTDKISGDIASSLRVRGIVKDSKDAKQIEVKEPKEVKPIIKKERKTRTKK